jgi:hypothetical protein
MWGLLERYCASALTFDTDYSANLYFAGGPAEPDVTEFACGPIGLELGLKLAKQRPRTMPWILERANTTRVSTTGGVRPKDLLRGRGRKRSTSFLSTTTDRVGRFFMGSGSRKNDANRRRSDRMY